MPSILVFGHKNPDNDAISAAIGYAYLKNELAKKNGEDVTYEAVRLGGLPPETEWILSENGIETPRLIEGVGEGDKVILVDHSEALQSAEGLENAEIVEIVDHHRLGGLTTAQPLRYNAMPVGSTTALSSSPTLLVSSASRASKCLRLSLPCCWAPCSPTR